GYLRVAGRAQLIRLFHSVDNVGNQAMARARPDAEPNAGGASRIPDHRHVVTARLLGRRDEIGKDDEVVLIVAGLAVEGFATGDQPQSGVVDVAVDPFGGELVLQVLGNLGDAKYRLGGVRPGARDLMHGPV